MATVEAKEEIKVWKETVQPPDNQEEWNLNLQIKIKQITGYKNNKENSKYNSAHK